MNRNVESHFALNPTRIDMSRSRFDRSSSVKFSFNTGDVVPFYLEEVLPGDTFKIKTSKIVRLQTLLTPMMDNVYLDFYYFFVPNRLTWEHWQEFCGENTQSSWIPEVEYEIPQVTSPEGGWSIGSIADYMGVPTGVSNLSVNALPFRAYALIMNEWFRDQNLMDPLNIPVTDATVAGSNGTNYITDVVLGGMPFKAAKYHDYFTSCLPAPQKGPDVTIPVAQAGNYPVYATSDVHNSADLPKVPGSDTVVYPALWNYMNSSDNYNVSVQWQPRFSNNSFGADVNTNGAAPVNLWAVASGNASAATINQLRLAFQIQKYYEKLARGGSRYIEILKSMFGVTSPDSRLQRPEYLGGNRVPINVNQIVQQSATQEGSTPQGNPVGLSVTSDVHSDFTKSFVEHGYVIGVCVARYDHTYQQGLDRLWSRKDKFDFYWPVFANIGEQAVKNKEIYAQGSGVKDVDGNVVDDKVFGYQEAWADYRYKPNRVAGEMRSSASQSLDVWHLGDDYSTLPALSAEWIVEDKSNIDRVLAVTSAVSNQLFADIYVENSATRPMPMYSIPGLIDHH